MERHSGDRESVRFELRVADQRGVANLRCGVTRHPSEAAFGTFVFECGEGKGRFATEGRFGLARNREQSAECTHVAEEGETTRTTKRRVRSSASQGREKRLPIGFGRCGALGRSKELRAGLGEVRGGHRGSGDVVACAAIGGVYPDETNLVADFDGRMEVRLEDGHFTQCRVGELGERGRERLHDGHDVVRARNGSRASLHFDHTSEHVGERTPEGFVFGFEPGQESRTRHDIRDERDTPNALVFVVEGFADDRRKRTLLEQLANEATDEDLAAHVGGATLECRGEWNRRSGRVECDQHGDGDFAHRRVAVRQVTRDESLDERRRSKERRQRPKASRTDVGKLRL